MQSYPDKLKIVNWNNFDVTYKNKEAIFTHCINFTGPLLFKMCLKTHNVWFHVYPGLFSGMFSSSNTL